MTPVPVGVDEPGLSNPALLRYALFALPLAMVALPLYIYLPSLYASRCNLPLTQIGAVLLGARLAAAFIDPVLGWWISHGRPGYGRPGYGRIILLALPLLTLGFIGLFHPPAWQGRAALAWMIGNLLLLYPGFGLAMIAHQSWGSALGVGPAIRNRVAGAREGCGLLGVLLAAGITGLLGQDGLALAFGLSLAVSAILLLRCARLRQLDAGHRNNSADQGPGRSRGWRSISLPLRQPRFRILFSVLLINGVAGAIPATLFMFFTADRLQLGRLSALFLVIYFTAAASSMPLWSKLALRLGEARSWMLAMVLASAVFVWAFALPAGAQAGFAVICLLSGLTLGADLALPAALLTAVMAHAGHNQRHEAAYFGLWNWGVQINLALAAGITLPLLGMFGYVPGQSSNDTTLLAATYALLPCTLKLLAAGLLWRAPLHDWPERPAQAG
jgi:Na+/melibiose symporter-like transporter